MSIFKAYDIRGQYPTELNADVMSSIGYAVQHYFDRPTVAVGRDARLSSPELASALIASLLQSGCTVTDLGVVSTPVLYYYCGSQRLPLGLMVTASHNPWHDNGLKLCQDGAKPVTEAEIRSIGELAETYAPALDPEEASLTATNAHDTAMATYADFIRSSARFDTGMRIAVDASNAVCGAVVPQVFSNLAVDVVPLFFELDGRFPNHQPDPLNRDNTLVLARTVVDESCNLGAALDGDGDRVIFIDERGRYVPADIAGLLIALDVSERLTLPAKVVVDTRASKSVIDVLGRRGIEVVRGRVGHSMVKAKIHEVGAAFGVELSGHYYFRESFFAESSDLAIVSMLNLLSKTGETLSSLVDSNTLYHHAGEHNFRVHDKARMMDLLRQRYSDGQVYEIDGVSIEYPSWWFNVRPSNTEDALRVNLEADSDDEMAFHLAEISRFIEEAMQVFESKTQDV